jgi:hypothetical protein
MEFLEIKLTKDLRPLLHAIHSPFYADFKENHTLLWFLKSLQKSAKQENSSLIMKRILYIEQKNKGEISTKMSFKSSISVLEIGYLRTICKLEGGGKGCVCKRVELICFL